MVQVGTSNWVAIRALIPGLPDQTPSLPVLSDDPTRECRPDQPRQRDYPVHRRSSLFIRREVPVHVAAIRPSSSQGEEPETVGVSKVPNEPVRSVTEGQKVRRRLKRNIVTLATMADAMRNMRAVMREDEVFLGQDV